MTTLVVGLRHDALCPRRGAFVDAVLCVGALRRIRRRCGRRTAAVLLAKQNATETAAHLSRVVYGSGNNTTDLRRCLKDCESRYEAPAGYLSDAAAALDKGTFDDAGVLIGGAQAEVKLCQMGYQAVWQTERLDALTERNVNVVRICSVATAITRLLQRH